MTKNQSGEGEKVKPSLSIRFRREISAKKVGGTHPEQKFTFG